jgi:hypothetical protein
MLPSLYQTNLENQLSESELLFLNLLINVLQDIKEVSLEKIANALPVPILFESRRKKIQRFLSLTANTQYPEDLVSDNRKLANSKFLGESKDLFGN